MRKKNGEKWLRCGLALMLTFVLAISCPVTANAETLEELEEKQQELEKELEELGEQLGYKEEEIRQLEARIEEVMLEISALDEQINACIANIADLEVKIADNEALLETTARQLSAAKETEAEYLEAMKGRIRMMYEYGDVNYLELLLGSKSISDFFSRIEYVIQMASYDEKIQKGLEETRREIQYIEGVQQQAQLQLDLDRVRLENEQTTLEATRKDKQDLYKELDKDKASAVAYSLYLLEIQQQRSEELAEVAARYEELEKQGKFTGTGDFIWPVPSSYYISSPYGWRLHPIYGYERLHAGTDIGADYWADIVAADSGYVYYVGYEDGGYGNFVMIDHQNGYITLYAHCNSVLVYMGQEVSQGETIALVGSTGASTGPHCHFEVWYYGSTTDPMNYFS